VERERERESEFKVHVVNIFRLALKTKKNKKNN